MSFNSLFPLNIWLYSGYRQLQSSSEFSCCVTQCCICNGFSWDWKATMQLSVNVSLCSGLVITEMCS